MEYLPYFLGALMIATSMYIFIMIFKLTKKSQAIKSWPTAQGEILTSDITTETHGVYDYFVVKSKFKYWAEGVEHTCEKPFGRFNTKKEAQAEADKHLMGTSVVATYNPKKPPRQAPCTLQSTHIAAILA